MPLHHHGRNFLTFLSIWKCYFCLYHPSVIAHRTTEGQPPIIHADWSADRLTLRLHHGCCSVVTGLTFHGTLQWRHNECDGVSHHQPHDCLYNRLFGRRSKKTSKLRVTGLCEGKWPVNSPHKWPVPRKMFPFENIIMIYADICLTCTLVTEINRNDCNSFFHSQTNAKGSNKYGIFHCDTI